MSDLFDLILSNRIYLITAFCMAGIIIFFIIKKMMKFILFGVIILIAFIAYIYFTGDSEKLPDETIEKVVKEIK